MNSSATAIRPSVSVIIPAHNAGRTLPACLASIRASEYAASIEVLVVDDASTDKTVAIAESYGCTVIQRRANGGPALARNAGARAASGEVLVFVDSDTEMRPETIDRAVSALEQPEVGAVVGMYEPEPINDGFFPRYYAYLKYHAFTCSGATRMLGFGAHCAAITKQHFDKVGGYRSIAWGVDVENEEFGRRINETLPITLARSVRVRHNFPGFRKLLMVFTRRVYWWILFQRFYGENESILMTREIGMATAAAPMATCLSILALALPGDWSAVAWGLAVVAFLVFLAGYRGFWSVCTQRRGLVFAFAAVSAAFFFSHVIAASAAYAHGVATWRSFRGGSFPFAESALGQT